jgi:quinol monooxygenase YgiN
VAIDAPAIEDEEVQMGFVQIMEFTTSRIDDIRALEDEWMQATEGKRTLLRQTFCADRDEPNRYVAIIEFDSYEAAMANSELPETQAAAEQYAALCDGPVRFLNLDVLETISG